MVYRHLALRLDSQVDIVRDGAAVTASGWLVVDGSDACLVPPQPPDLHRPSAPEACGDTSVRLVLQGHDAPRPPSGAWVRVTGIWTEREITVSDISAERIDLSLLAPPPLGEAGAPTFGEELAHDVGRVFDDRRRRWDLLSVGRASGRRPGPVVSVVAVRALPEIAEYVGTLPEGAVDFRPWLTSIGG